MRTRMTGRCSMGPGSSTEIGRVRSCPRSTKGVKLLAVILSTLGLATSLGGRILAQPEDSKKEGKQCNYCHVNEPADGRLTEAGRFYQAHDRSFSGYQKQRREDGLERDRQPKLPIIDVGPRVKVQLRFTPMGRVTRVSGNQTRVGEHQLLSSGPVWGLQIGNAREARNHFNFQGTRRGRDAQTYSFTADLSRVARIRTSYNRLLHRTDHDTLGNLSFSSQLFGQPILGGNVGAMRNTDTDPKRDYTNFTSELKNRLTVQPPFLSRLKLIAEHNRVAKQGHQQVTTITHCANCHIGSSTRIFDRYTDEFKLTEEVNLGRLMLFYTIRHYDFVEKAAAPSFDYGSGIEVTGVQPFALAPNTNKNIQQLRARLDLPKTTVYANYSNTDVRNELTANRTEMNRANVKVMTRPSRWLRLTGTYEWRRTDYSILNGIDRSIQTAGLRSSYHFWRGTNLRAEYQWLQIERKNFPFDRTGLFEDFRRREYTTRTNRIRFSLARNITRELRASVTYKRVDADKPFLRFGKQGSFAPGFGVPPNRKLSDFPYQNQTKSPEQSNEITADATWTPRTNLSLYSMYRFYDAENNSVNWRMRSHTFITNLLYATEDGGLSLNASYATFRNHAKADLIFGTVAGVLPVLNRRIEPMIDRAVPYRDITQTVSMDVRWKIARKLRSTTDFSFTAGESSFDSKALPDIGGFSAMSIDYIPRLDVGFEYDLTSGRTLYVKYGFARYADLFNPSEDGTAHILFFGLGWKAVR